MRKHDIQAFVWLTGSKERIKRSVYTDGNAYYVKWYGRYIEVKMDYDWGYRIWRTVESY